MQVQVGHAALSPQWPASVACIGSFDGVHLGHQAVIGEGIRQARARECPAVVVTFDRHPASVLAPDRVPPALATLDQNLRQFARLGVDLALVLPFDLALSQTSAEDFLDQVLSRALRTEALVIGHDFAFGQGRRGTPEWAADHLETTVIPPFLVAGTRVSSRDLRAAVAAGQMETVTQGLGRAYALSGFVIGGQKLGRQLGYPTANLALSRAFAIPQDGIYAGRAETPFGDFLAAISIGMRPTVDGKDRTIEAYLLDYPGDSLYGRQIELEFHQRLRGEEKFDSLEALVAQMGRDVEQVREATYFRL